MKTKNFAFRKIATKRITVAAMLASAVLFAGSTNNMTCARGGFGGGYRGGYAPEFRGAPGDYGRAGYGPRGADYGRGSEGLGYGRNPFDEGVHRPDAFNSTPRPSEASLQAGANRNYNWSGAHNGLSVDSGFGRLSSPVGNVTNRVSPAQLASRGEEVRGAYGYPGVFDRGWWADHPGAWGWGGWGNGWAWGGSAWPELAGWWGVSGANEPTEYDYGNNITYQNDTVYYGSQPVESSETYYNQAETIAQSVPTTSADNVHTEALGKNWKPLGVFSLVQGGQTSTTVMFQLAVNKAGAIKGNYYNALTGETKPVSGAVDKKGMRAAWFVGENKKVVYDTGVANLLQEQSTVLVHFGKDKTQQWTLVKLPQPKAAA
jgi:hypothetical protein